MHPVIIAGGGPAGLLLGLLLGRRGFNVHILEKAEEPNEWSNRSYFMGINARGMRALDNAGVLSEVREVAVPREGMALHFPDGSIKFIPRDPPTIGISRPRLMARLTEIIEKEGKAKIRHNCHVTGFVRNQDGTLLVNLSDGTFEVATHIIGADGKWSAVRKAAAEYESTQAAPTFTWTPRTENSWGARINVPELPSTWQRNIVHAVKAKTLHDRVHCIISESDFEKRCAAWVVFFDPILDHYPQLSPSSKQGTEDWGQDCPCSAEREAALRALLEAEFPEVAALIPADASASLLEMSVGGRSTWVDVEGTFDAVHGTVALIGDAAHCMTASIGEGCNCALESAVALDAAMGTCPGPDAGPPSLEALSEAFRRYGRERPAAVREVQLRAAAASRKPQN